MKTQDMINAIKGNLGNRASGRIGDIDIDVACLNALNIVIPETVQEAQPDYYNRTATLALVTGIREYSLPTTDIDTNTIKVKDIYSHRCFRVGGTEVSMIQLNYKDFVERTKNYNLEFEGTPSYYAVWGNPELLYLDYLPSEDYTLTLYIESYPEILTSANLNTPLPVDDQWNLVVEAGATKYLYLKLQQLEMYGFWGDLYERQKASVDRTENAKQSKNLEVGTRIPLITDPALDPRVRRWN